MTSRLFLSRNDFYEIATSQHHFSEIGIGSFFMSLKPGGPADLTIIDLEKEFTVDANTLRSKSRNTPFDGWELKGKAVLTMVGGEVVFDDQ